MTATGHPETQKDRGNCPGPVHSVKIDLMPDAMTPSEIRRAREELGLTQAQLAAMLETDAQTVRRMELAPDKSTHRAPAGRMVRLLRAYLSGYRPDDWPA